MAAVEAAARAPHAEHLSVSALHLLQAVARRLAASGPEARPDSPAAIWFRSCAAAICHFAWRKDLPSASDLAGSVTHARRIISIILCE